MSTGSPQADRRLEIALALLSDGDGEAAAEAVRAALELVPDHPELYHTLASALETAGRPAEAVRAYERYLALDPADHFGASVRLSLLGARPMPEVLPEAYVRRLFDQFAPRFDRSLLTRLDYSAPALLRAAVEEVRGAARPPLRVLDLGCGTGLAGAALRDLAVWLEGIDLSPAMLAKARERRVYDALAMEEATAALEARHAAFDLIVAADVLVYIGEIAPLLVAAAGTLVPGGLIAFTLERSAEPGVYLQPTHRYAHHPADVAARCAAAGLETLRLAPVSYRQEAGQPVPGLLVVARKPGELEALNSLADVQRKGPAGSKPQA